MNKPPFFIVGVGRSGTTLLRLMMNSHSQLAIPYESHFITRYVHKLDHYGDLNRSDNLRSLVQDLLNEELLKSWDHQFDFERIVNSINSPIDFGSVIDAIYSDYATEKNKVRWGDKSDYLDRMHLVNRVFPDSQFIHIVRDGRDVANSVMKLPWGPKDILRAADWWHEHVRLAEVVGSVLGEKRYTVVKYEDLVSNPEAELTRLCTFIGEQYSQSMLNYHKAARDLIPDSRKSQHLNTDTPPNQDRCFAWKHEMSLGDQILFNNTAAQTLSSLGYEVPNIPINKTKFRFNKARVLTKRLIRN